MSLLLCSKKFQKGAIWLKLFFFTICFNILFIILAVMEAIPSIICDTLYSLGLHDQTPSWKIMDNKGRITVVLHWEPDDLAALKGEENWWCLRIWILAPKNKVYFVCIIYLSTTHQLPINYLSTTYPLPIHYLSTTYLPIYFLLGPVKPK